MSAGHDELRRVLSELMADNEDAFERSQWPWETHRWYQLAYGVMAAVEGRRHPDDVSTAALGALLELELLDVERLAAPSWPVEDAHLMELVLIRKGFSSGDTQTIMNALRSLAIWVQTSWDGRIQRYLRRLGNELIDRVTDELPLEPLKHEQASLAVTHWLQDVLDVPVLIDSPPLAALLKRTGCDRSDALSVLDELDANAALADEILAGSSEGLDFEDDLSKGDE